MDATADGAAAAGEPARRRPRLRRLALIALVLLVPILVPWLIAPPEQVRSSSHGLMRRGEPGPPLSSDVMPHGFCLIWPVWEHTKAPAYYLVQGRTWWVYTGSKATRRETRVPLIIEVPAFRAAMGMWWSVVAHVRRAAGRVLGLDAAGDPFHERRIDDTMREVAGED